MPFWNRTTPFARPPLAARSFRHWQLRQDRVRSHGSKEYNRDGQSPRHGVIAVRRVRRHLHPPLERYYVTPQEDGAYEVSDLGALRGSFRLVARGEKRRVYLCQGEFRSLAHILKLSGGMVFTLEFRDLQEGGEAYLEIVPQFYLRLDNIVAHGFLKVLSPLLNGIIDRRVGNLTTATQVVGERMSRDPAGLYREMRSWPDVKPEELEAYRQAFLPGEGAR